MKKRSLGSGVLLVFSTISATAADPPQMTTNGWLPLAQMAAARAGACAAQLPDGRVLITGGIGVAALDSAELFAGGSFPMAAPMSAARSSHSCAVLTDGRVIVAGGINDAGQITGAEIYDPANNRWPPPGTWDMPVPATRPQCCMTGAC